MSLGYMGGLALLLAVPLVGCGSGSPVEELAGAELNTATGALDAAQSEPISIAACVKTVYVHIIAYGFTDYSYILNNKNPCWGLEAPKWSGGATWSICKWNAANPSGASNWAYDDVNIGATGHSDASDVADCKAKNGSVNGTVYVAANSGTAWAHGTVTGASKWLHECYDSDTAVNNRNSGCASGGAPMWNIGASGSVYSQVKSLCAGRSGGQWLGIYASTVGLSGKEDPIVRALNDCTTGL